MRVLVAMVLVASCASCSLLTTLDDLLGTDAAAPDARAEAADDARADAPLADASQSDGGPFCAKHDGAAFCEDFDQGSLAAWLKPFGTPALVSDASVSPPFSFVANVPADAGPASCEIERFLSGLVTPSFVHAEYEVRVDGNTQRATNMILYFNDPADGGHTSFVEIEFQPTTQKSEVLGQGGQTFTASVSPSSDVWTRVSLDVNLKPPATFSLTLDDGVNVREFPGSPHPIDASTGLPELVLGLTNGDPGSMVHIDNVLVEWDAEAP